MLKLQLLGSLDLLDAGRDISPVLRRPKSLALLAYLAAARPRGFHRRDTLPALFWPALDQAHARNALRQTVHSLRHELGGHVLIGRGEEELGVDSARLWCDVAQFEAHLDGHDLKAAVALYRGELLHGFHVSGANEFEAWQDQERKYLAKRALTATLDLSKQAERGGEYPTAVTWAKRAVEIGPYDESALRWLLRLLDHIGRRSDTVRARVEPQLFVSAGVLTAKSPGVVAQRPDSEAKTSRAPDSVRNVFSRSLGVFQAVLARVSASIRSIQRTKNPASSEERTGSSPTRT